MEITAILRDGCWCFKTPIVQIDARDSSYQPWCSLLIGLREYEAVPILGLAQLLPVFLHRKRLA
jgi:hypothetical protein